MCGIAGIFGYEGPSEVLSPVLARMGRAQIHRGPDEDGCWTDEELRCGLSFRRLSLVDSRGGSQPLASENGNVVLVCNGEIYNHRVLRRELEQRGHCFHTTSDCEVIVHLYEEEGVAALSRLEGMFALALIDRPRRRLLLARDRMGMKPLYYSQTAKGLLFASEAKALLASGLVEGAANLDGIGAFLTIGYVPAPLSAFSDMGRLAAGTYAIVEHGRFQQYDYWKPCYRSPESEPDERECVERLEHLLRSAVATHLDSEAPLGLFLSGGWDSSLVSVYAAQHASRRLKTFSLVFPQDPDSDESRFSRQVAAQIGSDHCEVEIHTDRITQILPEVVQAVEEPCCASPSPLLYMLAKAASRDVKGVLGGEGADELFAGYAYYFPQSAYAWRRWTPKAMLRPLADFWPSARLRRKLRMISAIDEQAAHREWLWVFPRALLRRLLIPELLPSREMCEFLRVPPATWNSCSDQLQERLSIDMTGRLPEGLLLVNDKVTMAHGLELRMPMLDASVVDFALSLPSHLKQRNGQEKHILSRLARCLPAEVAVRKKQGLQIPFQSLLTSPQGTEFVRQVLLDDNGREPLFQLRPLERWINHALTRDHFELSFLWRLVTLRIWWDCFMSSSATASSRSSASSVRRAA